MRVLLLGISFLCVSTLFGQDLLTIGEVFDFEIGDEFHSRKEYGSPSLTPPNAERFKVLDKYYSIDNDTLFYKCLDFSYYATVNQDFSLNYHYLNDTLTWSFTSLDSSLIYYDSIFLYDTIIETYNCGRLVNGYYYVDGDFEPTNLSRKYGLGLGLTYEYILEGGGSYNPYSKALFYYKKGDAECGVPDLFLDIKTASMVSVEIFPNPAHEKFTIRFDDKNKNQVYQVEIYTAQGKCINRQTIQNSTCVSTKNWEAGIYLIKITCNGQTFTEKLVVY